MGDSFAAGLVGLVLDDRYRLDAVLGEGGMGAVFRATHLAMERRVAVKLLKPHLTSDETQLQRFAREARSTLKVDSPHAVKVLDFGVTPSREYYMVLEYLDGRTVQRELDIDGPFTPARAVHVARQALHALGTAHGRGLVHRDIKPDNLLLMRSGDDPDYTKVLDFGVAKLMDGAARSAQSALALTQMGMVFGTPEFMSPEQACGHPLDGRSDLYSLAATVFAMVTGCGMFEGKSPIEWLTHHARTPPPHLADARPELAAYPELDEVLQRCLVKQRDRRPRDAAEMERLLATIEPTLRRAPGASPPAAAVMRAATASPSSFLSALPSDSVASEDTLVPSVAATTARERPGAIAAAEEAAGPAELVGPVGIASSAGRRAPATGPAQAQVGAPAGTDLYAAAPPRRGRTLLLAAGAIAVVAMIGVALGLALTRRPARTAEGSGPARADAVIPAAPDAPAPAPADAAAPEVRDAAIPDAAPGPAPVRDAAIPDARPAPDAGVRLPSPGTKKLFEEKLAEAKEARGAGNRLRFLALSDEAHKLDPRNLEAHLLYADALLATENFKEGCLELRALRRVAAARERAAKAGCPTN